MSRIIMLESSDCGQCDQHSLCGERVSENTVNEFKIPVTELRQDANFLDIKIIAHYSIDWLKLSCSGCRLT